MVGATFSTMGVILDFLIHIHPNIGRETTREGLIELHRLISGNAASVSSNLGGGWHRHLAPTMKSEDYAAQTGFAFVMPNNPGNYPPTM